MFLTMMKYQLHRLIRNRETVFWSLGFPIILGSLFFAAFGSVMDESETFKAVPVAIVEEQDADDAFLKVADELGESGEDQMLKITKTSNEEANKLLADEKVDGYISVGKEVKLVVASNGLNQSILEEVISRYNRMKMTLADIIKKDPSILQNQKKMQQITDQLTQETEFMKEKKMGSGQQDSMLGYFFSLIAFVCMYGSLWGLEIITSLQGNCSAIGARRCVAPTNKLKILMADTLSALIIHVTEVFLIIFYLNNVLGVDFGNDIGYIMLASVFGSLIGISFGIFVGAFITGKGKAKELVLSSISMFFSFCSGLMVVHMPHIIEQYFPLLNRINPCYLLVNCIMSLSVYSDKSKYFENLFGMCIMSAVLIVASFVIIRREKYASL